jgi:hypothetical protein
MGATTHRRLLARYLGTIALTGLGFAVVAYFLDALVSREFAAYVAGFGSLVAWIGVAQGQQRTCARAEIASGSRPRSALKLAPLVAAVIPLAFLALVAREWPSPRFVTLAGAASGIGLFWAVLSGCRSIARVGSGAARDAGLPGETPGDATD